MSRHSPPLDEDLQHLYNEVWAGFADEPTPTVQRSNTASTATELESLYGAYGGEDDGSPITNLGGRIPSVGSGMACTYL